MTSQVSLKEMKALEKSEIITMKGIGGEVTTVEIATQAPQICQLHAASGNVYDLAFDPTAEMFTLTDDLIVYIVG